MHHRQASLILATLLFVLCVASGLAGVLPVLAIRDLQGSSHISPYAGQAVAGIPGIVTQKTSNGFYMQDPNPDANDATSEGIFVFTSSAPTVSVGDSVTVSGTVNEFATGTTDLAITEITAPVVLVQSTGNPLPPPIVIGTGGRIPPNQVIFNGAAINLNTQAHALDMSNGIDFYESLEGMRVQLNNVLAVGPTVSGETTLVADNGANAGLLSPRGSLVVRSNDFNPERIIMRDVPPAPGPASVGTHITSVVGVISYAFGRYVLLRDLSVQLTVDTSGVPLVETTALTGTASRVTIASYVMNNLDPVDGIGKFFTIAGNIVSRMKSPDILIALEIQDNNGPTNDSTVDASTTITQLINAIVTAGGPAYQYRVIDPVDDQDGGEPGGNGRPVFLFNPARVSFTDRPGGTATAATAVVNADGVPQLTFSPGRIDPANAAWTNARKPLAGEFVFDAKPLFVIATHFNSKGGDQPLFGRNQPPAVPSETQRVQQATIVQSLVAGILAVDANARVAVAGDMNDFEFSNALTALKGGNLHNLTESLPQNERYTFIFDGNAQALDHILVSNALFDGAQYDIVHVNSEYPAQVSDHDLPLARLGSPCTLDLDGNDRIDPLTDGLMFVRALSGRTGDNVTGGAIGPMAKRSQWADIQPVIQQQLGILDVDGNGATDGLTDGLLIMRAMFGLTGTAVTDGAVGGPTPSRGDWNAIRSHLNSNCGTSYAQ